MQRDGRLDTAKGIAILAVISLHVLGNQSRVFGESAPEFSAALRTANELLQFAVPCFIAISTFLWCRSWLRNAPGQFLLRRVTELFQPYLLWSLAYGFASARWASATGSVDFDRLGHELLYGRAFYHLYFMILLAQLIVLAPILASVFKRTRIALLPVMVITGLAFVAIQWVLASFPDLRPGSFLPNYALVVIPSAWLAAQPSGFISDRSRARLTVTGAVIALALFFGKGFLPDEIPALGTVYGAFASLAVIGLASQISDRNSKGSWLAFIGKNSLPLYLVHPAVLNVVVGLQASPFTDRTPPEVATVWVLTFGLSLAATFLIIAARLGPILLGPKYRVQNRYPST